MNCAFILSKHFLIVKLPGGMFLKNRQSFFAYEGSPLSVVYYDDEPAGTSFYEVDRALWVFYQTREKAFLKCVQKPIEDFKDKHPFGVFRYTMVSHPVVQRF